MSVYIGENRIIGASLDVPHTSGSPMQFWCRRPCANNYRQNRKTNHQVSMPRWNTQCRLLHLLICFVSSTMPRWITWQTGKPRHRYTMIHGVDYCTSLFARVINHATVNYTANQKTSPSKWTEKKDYEGGESCIGWEERHPHLYLYQPSLQNSGLDHWSHGILHTRSLQNHEIHSRGSHIQLT